MWKQIIIATIIAGCLDIAAACLQAYVSNGVSPDIVLKFIASGVFGKQAYSGDIKYILFGLAFHFLIVFACVVTYFFWYTRIRFLRKSIWFSSLIIAVIAWFVTTRTVIPLSKIQPPAFDLNKAIVSILILYFCVGIPIALYAKYHYSK